MGGRLRRGKPWAALLAGLLLAVLLAPLRAAAQVAPDEDWRTLETEHFHLTFPAALEPLARRAGARAERAWEEITAHLEAPPGDRFDIVLTDHVDYSNGSASVAPRKRIVVYARPPMDGLGLVYFDDWMELVLTHELVHVFHLDRTSRVGRGLRALFGRVPAAWPFFPENGVPRWVVEGMATYYETALTGIGRTEGPYHEMVLRTAALEDRFETIDRTSGRSPEWPADRAYVYGSGFFAWLLERHGVEKMAAFVDAIAGQWIPYRLNSAAKHAFGASYSDEWEVWTRARVVEASALVADLAARAPVTRTETLTDGARYVIAPQISPDGRTLAFSRADGVTDAQLRVADPDGRNDRQLARTNAVPFFSYAGDGSIISAQFETDGPYRQRSDLYRTDPSGATTRVTTNARLEYPSAARDGRTAIAIRNVDGTMHVVRVDLATGAVTELTPPEPDVHWAFPALSPDGARIAVTRWRAGRSVDLVLLDASGRLLQEVTSDRAVEFAPSWSADGRWLIWTSDRSGIPNLFGAAVDATGRAGPVRQVTNVATGIAYASVDPDAEYIYAAGYHADGWEVERVPFDPVRWFEPFPLAPFYAEAAVPEPAPAPSAGESRPYRAFRSLVPGFWEPLFTPAEVEEVRGESRNLLEPGFGLFTFGSDVVGRHSYNLLATVMTDGRGEGTAAYSYYGLGNPILSLAVQQDWDASGPIFGVRSTGQRDTLYQRERERAVSLGVTALLRKYRLGGSLGVGGGLVEERTELLDVTLRPSALYEIDRPTARLADARVSASLSTARGHALAISTDEGAALSLVARARRELDLAAADAGLPGRDRSYQEGIGTLRAYQPLRALGLARHVLALRGAGGVADGPGADRFHYDVGGAGFHTFPVRGYRSGDRSGRMAWSAAAEWRFPIVRINRGWQLIPMHVDQVSGGLFADAGNAWGPELGTALPRYHNPMQDAIASVGAEVNVDLFFLFSIPIPLRMGVAQPLVAPDGGARGQLQGYLAIGASF